MVSLQKYSMLLKVIHIPIYICPWTYDKTEHKRLIRCDCISTLHVQCKSKLKPVMPWSNESGLRKERQSNSKRGKHMYGEYWMNYIFRQSSCLVHNVVQLRLPYVQRISHNWLRFTRPKLPRLWCSFENLDLLISIWRSSGLSSSESLS